MIPPWTAHQPVMEGADWITSSVFWVAIDFLLLKLKFITQLVSFSMYKWSKQTFLVSLFYTQSFYSLFHQGAGRLANIVKFKVPRRLDNSLIVTSSICKNLWHHLKSIQLSYLDGTMSSSLSLLQFLKIPVSLKVDFLYLSQSWDVSKGWWYCPCSLLGLPGFSWESENRLSKLLLWYWVS